MKENRTDRETKERKKKSMGGWLEVLNDGKLLEHQTNVINELEDDLKNSPSPESLLIHTPQLGKLQQHDDPKFLMVIANDLGRRAYESIERQEEKESRSTDIDNKRSIYLENTDLGSPARIVQENFMTVADVIIFLSRHCETLRDLLIFARKLVNERPKNFRFNNIDLNPNNETYFELMARAPFAFWGRLPELKTAGYMSFPSVHDDSGKWLVSPHFVYELTRANIAEKIVASKKPHEFERHGGCPVLHPSCKGYNLITRLGNIVLDYAEAAARQVKNEPS